MSPALPLLLAALNAAAPAADATAPAWPERAYLQVSTNELLYDEPARTEDELLRRQGLYGVSLGWPAASDDVRVVRYRVLRAGKVLATLEGDARRWSGRAKGSARYSVQAGDASGNWSEPLSATVRQLDPFGGNEPMNVMGASLSSVDEASFGGLTGVGSGLGGLGARPSNETPQPDVELRTGPVSVEPENDAMGRAIARTTRTWKYCLGRHAAAVQGKSSAILRLTVSPAGRVVAVEHESQGAPPALVECLAARARRAVLPSSTAGAKVTIPVALTPKAPRPKGPARK